MGRKLTADTLEAAGEQYFSEKRDYQTDVETFFKSIRDYAPKSINMILSFTKGFLGRNGGKFDEYYWRDLKGKHKGLKGNRALTEDQGPTPEILRKILQFMPLHGRAFAPAASSSGMRLGETLRLKLSDIELDKAPSRIHIRKEYSKSGLARPSFLSAEAVDVVKEWLKIRDEWLKAASRKSHLYTPKGQRTTESFHSATEPSMPCGTQRSRSQATRKEIQQQESTSSIFTLTESVTMEDFRDALERVKPSMTEDMENWYKGFTKRFKKPRAPVAVA